MTPFEFADKYHQLAMADSLLGLTVTLNTKKLKADWATDDIAEASQVLTLVAKKFLKLSDYRAVPAVFSVKNSPLVDPDEEFCYASIRRAFCSRGSPGEMSDALRIAVLVDRNGNLPPKEYGENLSASTRPCRHLCTIRTSDTPGMRCRQLTQILRPLSSPCIPTKTDWLFWTKALKVSDMKKLKHETELFKGALQAGMRYAIDRKAAVFEPSDSVSERLLFIYRLLVLDKIIQPLPEVQIAEATMRHKLAIWYSKQLPKDHPLLN